MGVPPFAHVHCIRLTITLRSPHLSADRCPPSCCTGDVTQLLDQPSAPTWKGYKDVVVWPHIRTVLMPRAAAARRVSSTICAPDLSPTVSARLDTIAASTNSYALNPAV
eukprot:GHRR01035333.1.p1 GENE.GHRR01035333.1~~GHRR01035333.1.p1  ORF type:complete len:109 (-),score=10.09 GHRR01035333.1:25-351(-)